MIMRWPLFGFAWIEPLFLYVLWAQLKRPLDGRKGRAECGKLIKKIQFERRRSKTALAKR